MQARIFSRNHCSWRRYLSCLLILASGSACGGLTGEDSAEGRQKEKAVAAPDRVYPDCSDGTVLLSELDADSRWMGPMASGSQAIYILTHHPLFDPSLLIVDKLGAPKEADEWILDEELQGPTCLAVGDESIFIGASDSVYRMSIDGGPLERIHQREGPPVTEIRDLSCDLELLEGHLFFRDAFHELWSIEEGKARSIAEDVLQFTTNSASLFWKTEDGDLFFSDADAEVTFSRSDIKGSLLHAGDRYLYFRGSESEVFRLPTEGGKIQLALETIDEEEGGDVRSIIFFEDEFYLSSDRGELLHASLGDELPAPYEIKEERGSFDDDDFSSAMTVDEAAVYWLSGPILGVRSSDNDPVALWATCH